MKKIGLAILYFLLFILFFVVFMPKDYLYYKTEHILKDYGLIVSNEKVKDRFLSLSVKDGDIFIQGVKAGYVDVIDIYPDIVFNAVVIKGFKSNKNISLIPPIDLEELLFMYTPFYPFKVSIKANSSFGKMEGFIDLKDKKVVIDIFGEPKTRGLIRLKKINKRHYRYESKF